MKFVFPKNYNFSFKFLGIISYSSIIINIIYGFLLYFLISIFFKSFIIKFYCFISFFIPFFLFTSLNHSNENIFIVISYILKYLSSPKVYFYDKRF